MSEKFIRRWRRPMVGATCLWTRNRLPLAILGVVGSGFQIEDRQSTCGRLKERQYANRGREAYRP